MRANLVRQYFIIVFFLSLAIALTIRFPMVMNMVFSESGSHHEPGFSGYFSHFMVELVATFLIAFLMFAMNFFILKPVEKHGHLKVVNIILAVVLTVASVYILNHLLFSALISLDQRPSGHGRKSEFDLINFFVSALVVGCVLIIRLIFQRQTMQVENEALKREALQSQYESLKNQLSPHFLFNSLTTLKILIQESESKAQNYVSSLSKALRYTLQSNEKQLVTLKEEMLFMESYLYLIRIRYDKNLVINTIINEDFYEYRLPPLTIQTLVENAIKHNIISSKKPLAIDIITTDGGNLMVRNEIQKKLSEEEGTGIGLANLSKQFRLLLGKEIVISQKDNKFIVEIPLIKT